MKTIVLYGETASKKNNKVWSYKQKRLFSSERYVAWNKQAKSELANAKNGFFTEECKLIITFYHNDKRRRDSDNAVSSLFDTLKEAEYIPDDNWKVIPKYYVNSRYEVGCLPRVEINIYEPNEKVILEF